MLEYMLITRLQIIATATALLIMGAGCQTTAPTPPTMAGIVYESCDFDREGKLFDYRSQSCVVATRANFDRLYHYAYLYKLVRLGDKQIGFNVVLQRDRGPQDLISMLSLTLATEDRLSGVLFHLPSAPRGGWSTGSTLTTQKTSFADALEELEQLTIKNWLERDFIPSDLQQEMIQHLVQKLAQDDYFIRNIDLLAKPSSVMKFLVKYDSEIELVEELRPEDRISSSPSSPLPLPPFERLLQLPEGTP